MSAVLLGIATSLAPQVLEAVWRFAARGLSPDEQKIMRRALAEAILEVANDLRPSATDPVLLLRWKRRRKELEAAIDLTSTPSTFPEVSGVADDKIDRVAEGWRERMANQFANLARQRREDVEWIQHFGGLDPDTWGKRVQRSLEKRIVANPKLEPLLIRLDRDGQQEAREAAAVATLAYLRAIDKALILGLAILLALVAIAVILAVT